MTRHLRGVFAAIIWMLCGACLQPAEADQFHAILVADTNDPGIGHSARSDIRMAKMFAEAVARHFEERAITVLTGDGANPGRVQRTITNLDPGLDDFVFLYYTGHGDTSDLETPWPKLYFGSSSVEAKNLVLATQSRVPLRLLAVFDACNGSAELPPRRLPAAAHSFKAKNVQRLFKSFEGDVIITSSEAPYVSYADAEGRGSVFSSAFFSTLGDVLTAPADTSSWEEIAGRVARQTSNMPDAYRQVPKFEISPQ